MKKHEVENLLKEKAAFYNHPEFVDTDPIQIPASFTKKEDIEISGFLAAVIAWGQRKTIINNSKQLMELMENSPHDFILNHSDSELSRFEKFVHRTFNGDDCLTFIYALRKIYREKDGLEALIGRCFLKDKLNPGNGWSEFKRYFFDIPHLRRTEKHLPDPLKGSAAKRMNMFLRWMVRKDEQGVDFGIWEMLTPSQLYIPLDVHSARVARKLRLLKRKQNDWKAVIELTDRLKKIDSEDPIRFDFALFGMGVFEKY